MEKFGTVVLILLTIALVLFIGGQAQQLLGGAAPTPAPQVVVQNLPPQQVVQAPAQQQVAPQPQTTSANPPQTTNLTTNTNNVQPASVNQGGDYTTWVCPGEQLGNKCMLSGSADLVAGLCIDYDFRSTSIAGPHEDVDTNVTQTSRRAKITGPAAYMGQFPATVYKDPGCGPYPEGF